MKTCVLESPSPMERNPLAFTDAPEPEPGPGEVLIRVRRLRRLPNRSARRRR